MSADHKLPMQLPEDLRAQFAVLERRLWYVDMVIAIAGAVSGLLLSYALVFVSDRFWDTPVWLRLAFTALGILVLLFFAHSWLRAWVWKRRDTRALANIVQRQHRRLGDRLLGIVELAEQNGNAAHYSPALCRAAIAQVSKEALKFDFRLAVATRKPKLFALAAIALFLLVLTPCVLVPDAGANAFARWIWPATSTPRYTFVSLSDVPEKLIVPHGESFEIECGVVWRAQYRPQSATCQYERQPVISAPIKNNKVVFKVPPQTDNGRLYLRVGDANRVVQVQPTYRPTLRLLQAHVQMPAYLHYPDFDREVKNGRLTAVEGSTVQLHGQATRPLTEASLGETKPVALTVKNDAFSTPPVQLAGEIRLSLSWKDVLGLRVRNPETLTLSAHKDAPPEVELPETGRAVAVLEDEVLPIRLTSQDDFGVKALGVKLELSLPQKPEEPQIVTREVKTGGYREKKLEGKYEFSPLVLHLPPGSLVGLRGTAVDYLPNRQPAESGVCRILVMSKEEHARAIQEEFEKLRAAVEELTRKQENLAGDTKLLKDLKKLATDEMTRELADQALAQKDYAQQLEKLAQDALKTTKEALRNSSIPTDTVKDWTENVEKMQDIARQQMSQASQNLQNAQKSQKDPQQRQEQMAQAQQKEQEALQGLQDLQKKMAAVLDKMQAKSLADRLKAVGQTEKNVGGELGKSLPETIGLLKDQLPPAILKAFAHLGDEQGRTSKISRKLQEEIQRFFQRTGTESHGAVAKEMDEVKVAELIAKVGDLIKENISSQAMSQSQELAQRFFQWAEKLEGEKKDNASGSSSSGGGANQEMSEADLERMLALLRIRESQEAVREQTRLLDEYRKGRDTYAADTAKLAGTQDQLSGDLSKLKRAKIFTRSRERMDQANDAMDDAGSNLVRPRTDEPTQSFQSDAMNLLDDAIRALMPNNGNSQGQQQQQQQGMMAFMQMMAMGQSKPEMGQQNNGRTPGGNMNNNGGPSNRPNTDVAGDTQGKASGPRTVDKTGSGTARVLPSEFRDALQSYFNAVEKVK